MSSHEATIPDRGMVGAAASRAERRGPGSVTTPSAKWPKCGRIMAIRSGDEGKTWSKPVVIVDTPHDDRDPSLSCLMRASRVRFRPTGRNGRAVLDTPDRSRFPGAGRPVSGAGTD